MFDGQDAQALLELLIVLQQEGRVDPESDKYKQAEELINKLFSATERRESRRLSLDDILTNLENRRGLIERRKEVYLEEDEARRQILSAGRRAENQIKEKIALLLVSDESAEEDIEALRDQLKVLHKTNKAQQNEIKLSQKGAAAAESLLQSTLGISQASKDIMGFVKGYRKGLGKSITASNILASTVIKVFEMFAAVDGATAGLFQKTGVGKEYTGRIVQTGRELGLAFGVQSETVSAELFAEVMTSRRSFDAMADEEVDKTVVTAGKLSRLGVSVSAYVDIGKFLSLNLDKSIEEQEETLGMFYRLGKETKTSPEKMFREVAESLPVYSRYLNDFPRVFAGIHLAAKRTNVSVTDLMNLTESLDTTDQALKQAQKFNALLGGNFLNPVALLAADPGQKVKLIAEAYRRAQESLGQIHPRVVRSLYQNFGLDAQRFKNIVNASFETFDEELSRTVQGTPTLMDQVAKDIEKSKSAGEKVENALATMFKAVGNLVPVIVDLVKKAIDIARAIMHYHPLNLVMMLFEKYDEQKILEKRKEASKKSIEPVSNAIRDMDMSPEVAKFAIQSALPQLPPAGIAAPSINDFRDFATQTPEQKKVTTKNERIHSLLEEMSYDTFMDSPTAMNVGPSRPTPQVPTINAKYETSSQDDVLLSRLGKLRDKIHEYRQKSTKINLNVGLNNIAEATV